MMRNEPIQFRLELPVRILVADRAGFLFPAVPKVPPLEPNQATLKRWESNAGLAGGSACSESLGYLHTGDLRAVQEFLGHAGPRMTSR
jgi:integrase